MKTSKKQLEILLNEIIQLTSNKNLQLEFNSTYGGYRLVNVNPINGGHSGAFDGNGCEARLNASKMYIKLRGIISGLEYNK